MLYQHKRAQLQFASLTVIDNMNDEVISKYIVR